MLWSLPRFGGSSLYPISGALVYKSLSKVLRMWNLATPHGEQKKTGKKNHEFLGVSRKLEVGKLIQKKAI